jgi:anti-sigma regulatory factor (Ser/Thr protein kinase)
VLDTDTGLLHYSNAGHMPAMLARPESGTSLLNDARSVPLAVRRDQPRPQASMLLPFGSTLMLFTDGLVERKHESIDDGIDRAAAALVETMELPLDAVCDVVLRELAPTAGYDDDVAMVIYRRRPGPLRIESVAAADELANIRHRLADWLADSGVPDPAIDDIVLVINEGCTNCVEHAYRGHDVGAMLLEVRIADAQIKARITDSGSWKTPKVNPGNSGRGLVLMRILSETMDITSSPTGTTIEITFSPQAAGQPTED